MKPQISHLGLLFHVELIFVLSLEARIDFNFCVINESDISTPLWRCGCHQIGPGWEKKTCSKPPITWELSPKLCPNPSR